MKSLSKAAAVSLLLAAASSASAQNPWLHIYYPNGRDYQAFDMTEVLDITFDEEAGTMSVNTNDGTPGTANSSHSFFTSNFSSFEIGPSVPAIRITTDQYISEITSKSEYVTGNLNFEGRGFQDDYSYPLKIRGRGNSTWSYPKKPYRLKFAEKQRLLLPKKAKNFVLLANYIDPSMMRNFVAFKFGEIVEMPWINHSEPVNVYLNDIYKGSYQLTEKVGFNNGSVNLKAADEANSIMFELDTYTPTEDDYPFDSEFFNSDEGYYLPVRVKDPDAPTDPTELAAWQEKWQDDFNEFMGVIATGNLDRIFEWADIESLVRYVMVANIACNQELDHPKSVYLYKTEGGKYYFGPCWDFDWAFGYQPTYSAGSGGNWGWGWTSSQTYENPLLGTGKNEGYGGEFFLALCNNERFLSRFKEVWDDFYANKRDLFWAEFEAYAAKLRPSASEQGLSNSSYQNFDTNVQTLRTWVENRIEFINTDANHGLWEDSKSDW